MTNVFSYKINTAPTADDQVVVATVANNIEIPTRIKLEDMKVRNTAGTSYTLLNLADGTRAPAGDLLTATNVGTAATGSTAAEYGDGRVHQTVLTTSTTLPAIAGGAALGVGKLLYTFPAGAIIVEGAYISVGITQTQAHINADTPTVGVGTVIASGVVSVLSGTSTFQNIVTGQVAANCTGTATVKTATPTASVPFVIESGAAHTIYFNAAATWAASGDAAALLAGTVVLNWRFMA